MSNSIPDLTQPGAALCLAPEYRSHYQALVRPHLRFTVTRYLAERWVPTLGLYRQGVPAGLLASAGKAAGRTAWLIVQCRQVVYWNDHDAARGRHSFKRTLDFLSRESGLSREMILESLNEPLCQWFIQRASGKPRYDPGSGRAVQAPNVYTVRMDDPLVPIDAEHLAHLLVNCPYSSRDPLERALGRVQWGLEQPTATLRAPDVRAALQHPEWFEQTTKGSSQSHTRPPAGWQPPGVLELLKHIDPALARCPHNDERWLELAAACETLTDHVIAPRDVLGDYYYFRKNWVKVLGRGQAWAVVLLRDRCYDRDEAGQRDTCWLPDYDWLAQRIGVDAEKIGMWLKSGLDGFVRVVDQKKGWDRSDPQRVGYTVWVALRDPLTSADQAAYQARLESEIYAINNATNDAEAQEKENNPPNTEKKPESPRLEGGSSANPDSRKGGVIRESRLSEGGGHPRIPTLGGGVIRESRLSEGGSSANPDSLHEGVTRESRLMIVKKVLLSDSTCGGPPPPPDSPLKSEMAQQVLTQGGAGDNSSLSNLLQELGINNPSRARILEARPSLQQVVGWALYAAHQPDIKNLCGFLVARLLDETERHKLPEPFAQLADLTRENWTAFALACRRQKEGLSVTLEADMWPMFQTWAAIYGQLDFCQLPFGLGEAAARVWENECGHRHDGSTQTGVGTERSRVSKWQADYG